MVVVAACGDERRLRAGAGLLLEAEDAAVEADRPLEIRDLQMDVADVDAGIDAHPGNRSVHVQLRSAAREIRAKPAANHTVKASQWMPITSVCTPSARTAANAAASQSFTTPQPGDRQAQRTNPTTPAMPASTPSSV